MREGRGSPHALRLVFPCKGTSLSQRGAIGILGGIILSHGNDPSPHRMFNICHSCSQNDGHMPPTFADASPSSTPANPVMIEKIQNHR